MQRKIVVTGCFNCPYCKRKEFEYYLDYSIGFATRGCFRQCSFCVNKNYKKYLPSTKIWTNDRYL